MFFNFSTSTFKRATEVSTYSRFYKILLGVILTISLLIASFNIIVDPYGVINSPTLLGFNISKPAKASQIRLFKTIDVIRLRPKAIFLGTSRVDLGLDPTHEALRNQQPVYNLGLPKANMYEVLQYFHHALTNNKNLSDVVLEVDFYLMFNSNTELTQSDFKLNRLNKKNLNIEDAVNAIFSSNAIYDSLETIKDNINYNINPYLNNGMRTVYYEPLSENNLTRFKKKINNYLNLYKKYHLAYQRLQDLQTLVNLCKANKISLKVFIDPLHATQYEAMRAAGLWSEFERWKREVVKITPVWDFSGYNSITSEPINNNMKYYFESSHYRKEVGDLVINRLFSYQEENAPLDFGTFITLDNIESHLAKINDEREVWANKNPGEAKLVEDLNSKLGKKP